MKLIILIFTLCVFSTVYSQDTPCFDSIFVDNQLEKLQGKWIGKGVVAGDNVDYYIVGKWILNHQFFQISLSDTANVPAYAAEIFIGYDCKKEQYIAHWIDQFGGPFSKTLGIGKKANSVIDFQFDYPEGLMSTLFIFMDPTHWEIQSKLKNPDGTWNVFGDIKIQQK